MSKVSFICRCAAFCLGGLTTVAADLELTFVDRTGDSRLSVSRLSYLVTGVTLESESGSWIAPETDAAWLDHSSDRTTAPLGNIPSGRYERIRFFIGPDATDNAAPPNTFPADHPLNPILNSLHWGWQGGYVFMAVEGHSLSAGARPSSSYSLHLANDANRTAIDLPVDVLVGDETGARIELEIDIDSLLSGIPLDTGGISTHSRPGDPIAATLKSNLGSAFAVVRTSTLNPDPAASSRPPLFLPENPVGYPLTLPATFPLPPLPADNPLLIGRVNLGEKLFNEVRLSKDSSLSCATCHEQARAFTDGEPVSTGIGGRQGTRNAMPLFNLAWKDRFFWDGRAGSLREQVLEPIQHHAEMGETLERATSKLASDPAYAPLFESAFGSAEVTAEKLGLTLENYLLTLVSTDSEFEAGLRGESTLSAEAKRGFELFITENDPRTGTKGADCFHCHGGALFTNNGFQNNGLKDGGSFATPSLRNIALTAPYMHDGRFSTLEEVVDHYNTGLHRSPEIDPNLGKHPKGGLGLSKEDCRALVAFLESLTDPQFLIP